MLNVGLFIATVGLPRLLNDAVGVQVDPPGSKDFSSRALAWRDLEARLLSESSRESPCRTTAMPAPDTSRRINIRAGRPWATPSILHSRSGLSLALLTHRFASGKLGPVLPEVADLAQPLVPMVTPNLVGSRTATPRERRRSDGKQLAGERSLAERHEERITQLTNRPGVIDELGPCVVIEIIPVDPS